MKEKLDYQDLQALICEYKINLFRNDAYTRSIVLAQLDMAQKELLARIISSDLESITKRQLDALIRDINAIVSDNYERIDSYLKKTGSELFATAYQAEASIYNQWLGAQVFSSIPRYRLEAAQTVPLFEGRALGDWWKRQEDDLKFKLENIIRQGNIIGDTQQNLIKQVKHSLNISRNHAETLIRTGNAAIANDAQEYLIEQNADLLESKQQLSTLDSRTTDVCIVRDLRKWTIDNKPIGHDLRFRKPPLHANCRSLIIMLLKNAVLSTRASEFGQVRGDFNYSDYLKQQSNSYQAQVLGKKRAEWFRQGKLELRQMLNQDDRSLTIKQLRDIYKLD